MVRKLIILSPIPVSAKLYDDFYIKAVRGEGIEVEYWDFSLLLKQNDLRKAYHYDSIRQISTKAEFIRLLDENRNNKNLLMVTAFTFCYRFLFIYRTLNKYDFPLSSFARGALPTFSSSKARYQQKLDQLTKLFKPSKWKNICQTLFILGLKYLGLTKKVDFIFQAGKNGSLALGAGSSMDFKAAKQLIHINYFDYDKCLLLNQKDGLSRPSQKHIVFLDDYMPHHPDFDLLQMQKVNPFKYYEEINRFFKYVEDLTNLPVVIAAHPKAVYEENPFENRRICFNQTVELVRDSDFVLAHASSSIGFAVCFEKRIILMSSDEIKTINTGYVQHSILGFKYILHLEEANLSERSYTLKLRSIKVDFERYNWYKYAYLTSKESENTVTQSIFLSFLNTSNLN